MAAVRPLTIRYLPPAERDIHAIADYLLERNPRAAVRVRAAILRTLEIALFPSARQGAADAPRPQARGAALRLSHLLRGRSCSRRIDRASNSTWPTAKKL